MKIVYLDTVIRKTSFTVTGEPASKSNSRKIVKFGRRMALIKSAKARDYVKSFNHQIKKIEPLMTGDLVVEMTIWYATRRPDLDESVILDCMQGVIYENDRQVKEKHIYHGLDKENPRAEISVWLKEKSPE